MKKFKLIRRNKRFVIQLALLVPIVIITGVDLLYPSILILSALAIRGLISLYGNDPYFKENAEQISQLNSNPMKKIINTRDVNMGTGSMVARRRIYGY